MRNKIIFLSLLLILCVQRNGLLAQKYNNSNSLTLSIGQGFDDGLISVSKIPTIGVGYERQFNRYFSFYSRSLFYYRRSSKVSGQVLGIQLLDEASTFSTHPFADKELIEDNLNRGLQDFSVTYSQKKLSIPLSFGVIFSPLRIKQHSLNLHLGGMIMFESFNFAKDLYSTLTLTTSDGVEYSERYYIPTDTYFRHVILNHTIGVSYEFKFEVSSLALYFGEENGTGPAGSSHIFDLSIIYKYKF